MRDLLLRRWKWTLRSGSIGVEGVAGRPAEAVWLLIHGETGGGRGATSGRMDDTSSGGWLEIGCWGCLRLTVTVTVTVIVSVGLSL